VHPTPRARARPAGIDAEAEPASPRDAIRRLRKQSRMTLRDVSEQTGLTISTLSRLERGRISLSHDKLMRLSKALGVETSQLLETSIQGPAIGGAGRRVVHRAGEGVCVQTSGYKQVYLATELLNKRLTPLLGEVNVRTMQEFVAEFGDFIRHPGEEFALVLEGEIEFHTEFYAPVRLKTGDSVYFDSGMGHAYLKASERTCRIVVVCSPRGSDGALMEPFISASGRRAGQQVDTTPAAPRVQRTKARGAR
jgi:transcriptional regulator with XRE-family HTH domain